MTDIKKSLRKELLDKEYAQGYAESFFNAFLAAQIKILREQRGMTQAALAVAIGTTQTGISRFENVNYSSWSIRTLIKLARAFDVRLKVSFETFGSLPDEVIHFQRENLERVEREKDPYLSEDDIEAATQWCSKIAGESLRKKYIKIDAANRALVRTIAQLRLQLEKLQKRFDSAWDHIAATSIALDTPVGMNNADYAAQLKLDNAQKDKRVAELEHDVAEWSTVANLGNDRIAAAKAVGVVFTDPGTTCVNQRAEDAEAKVRGLSAEFMCQAELEGGK